MTSLLGVVREPLEGRGLQDVEGEDCKHASKRLGCHQVAGESVSRDDLGGAEGEVRAFGGQVC